MKSARKRKHSSVASEERTASLVLTGTSPEQVLAGTDTQKKRQKQSRISISVKNAKKGESSAIRRDPNISGESQPPSVDTSTDYKCSICLDSTRRKKMKPLPCSHTFHQICIDTWLKMSRRCPLCRQATAPPQNVRTRSSNQMQSLVQLRTLLGMRFGLIRGGFYISDDTIFYHS
ncbi:uncharacterized protein LOC129962862 [Argiope bruennichi]|uniref:E3 ubiquitin-protein ligase RNF165 like protein n=1 Tax=Argiope bruennichi TaxID=94029 RepID=A0A8T0EZW1_ARGBR|nr:uncharacterized protein LOC129962862 [Argiope bruennichi]KAF8782279.1 E3 ubiquitin-protein ligase RNF165 like protein [Argiope bruennichi]